MSDFDPTFIKTYEPPPGDSYQFTTMVRHQGIVIAFAMDEARHIFYSVLQSTPSNDDVTNLNLDGRSDSPQALPFPNEIVEVKSGSPTPVKIPQTKTEGQPDSFLSSTARLSAPAAFQVLSDGRYLYLFRQSVAGDDNNNVYLVDGTVVNTTALPDPLSTGGQEDRQPLVDHTLLLDRFVLDGDTLNLKSEAQYRRSRSKKDDLELADTANKEPTHLLSFVQHLYDGRFSVLLLPTETPGQDRWQIYAYNTLTQNLDTFNFSQSANGLFQMNQAPASTMLDDLADANMDFSAGAMQGEALTNQAQEANTANWALTFSDRSNKPEAVVVDSFTPFPASALTFECWVKVQGVNKTGTLCSYLTEPSAAGETSIVTIANPGDLTVQINKNSTRATGVALNDGDWHHLTVCWQSIERQNLLELGRGVITIYKDGNLVFSNQTINAAGQVLVSKPIAPGETLSDQGRLVFGQQQSTTSTDFEPNQGLHGVIGEVRLWNVSLDAAEIRANLHYRLLGNEPGLVGYWRFDEATGTTIVDQTSNGNDGIIYLTP
ncbi:MAG: LamG-like jellyroll fold domain-containing protein [Chloroflexota bacterium]